MPTKEVAKKIAILSQQQTMPPDITVEELVGFGSPIMSILLTNDISGTFNIREDQLKGMKIGTTFRAFVPALNREITMVVTSMKDEGAYAVWKATKTNGQYDLKTFEVKAKPTTKVKGLL